ncbi:MAG: hypothetical protein VR68_00260 [Peptococcaceae bacterium BRH_c4a]|nr:MAG: hypothetical protein VR68_00260 [Peptococcaceae bacterium BRH_c4a]
MDNNRRQSRVYQFDPNKKKLKSVNYVDPEKKHMAKERKQAQKDRRNFMIGVALLVLAVVALTFFKLGF